MRIAYEVAMHLRILPRFSDDGAPEGTVDRPLSVEPTVERVEVVDEEDEVEILLDPPA
ncbi:MAG TPA: hypothetical protein VGB42_12155 [Candidatus Thermoplasmatota archaeon]